MSTSESKFRVVDVGQRTAVRGTAAKEDGSTERCVNVGRNPSLVLFGQV